MKYFFLWKPDHNLSRVWEVDLSHPKTTAKFAFCTTTYSGSEELLQVQLPWTELTPVRDQSPEEALKFRIIRRLALVRTNKPR